MSAQVEENKSDVREVSRPPAQEISKLDYFLNNLTKFQFVFEIALQRILGEKFSQNRFVELLAFFQAVTLYLDLKQYRKSKNKYIFVSEDNEYKNHEELQQIQAEQFLENFKGETPEQLQNCSSEEIQEQIKNCLENIKNKPFRENNFNDGYEETLVRSSKRIGLVSKLPIPAELLGAKSINKSEQQRVIFGEYFHIIRPFVYCVLIRVFGLQSYTPYVISLIFDLLRLYIQRKVVFFNQGEKQEFINRNQKIIWNYLLRRPFYDNIFKGFITKILSIFGKQNQILSLVMFYFQMQSSLSLVI